MPYVNSDGVNIYYETYGQGTPIVFLHPFSFNGYIWYFQIFSFARTNQCVVIDDRGHGRSEKPQQGYSIPQMAKDLAAVLDHLGIDRAVLVGNSIGGMIAMQFSLDYPDRSLGNLILSSATGQSRNIPPEMMAELEGADYQEHFGQLIDFCLSGKSMRDRRELLDTGKAHVMVEDNLPRHAYMSSIKDPEGVFHWNITHRLNEISNPTLIIAGEEDRATPVAANKELAEGIPGAELRIIPQVGHLYQLEQPLEFNEALREFVNRVAG